MVLFLSGFQTTPGGIMGWDHGTFGWGAYEGFVNGLKELGTVVEEREREQEQVRSRGSDLTALQQNLRIASFTNLEGQPMVCEEYLAVDDGDCDGRSEVAISIYQKGQRPRLVTKVYDYGHDHYPIPSEQQGMGGDFLYVINDGTIEPLPEEKTPASTSI